MSEKMRNLEAICAVVVLIVAVSGTAQANWEETFDGMGFDLTTWTFGCFPDVTKTFSATIKDGPGDDDYLGLDETTAFDLGGGSYGSAFGMGFGSTEDFSDVRVGALVNITGDASRNYFGVAARAGWFIDPDGTMTGVAPGMVVSGAYILLVHWEDGPTNMRIEILKIVMNDDEIMGTWQPEVPVPGEDHARSRYIELDVVGSDPVYVTGSIYEYKGGPLLARTPAMVDTGGNDPWEKPGLHDGVYASGKSGVFSINENADPVGYHVTFDSVSSVSDGPAALCLSPPDGATGVDVNADLTWIEAEFATSRVLWLGREGAMEKVVPAPAGTTYDPGPLNYGQTYEWRVDQIGSTTVTGRVWRFTTELLVVDDFESYTTWANLRTVWTDGYTMTAFGNSGSNITVSTEIDPRTTGPDVPPDDPPGPIHGGSQAMQFAYDNDGSVTLYVTGYDPFPYSAPYYSEIEASTSGLGIRSNWTLESIEALTLYIYGNADNVDEQMYLVLEDSDSNSLVKCEKVIYGGSLLDLNLQLEDWQEWNIDLDEFTDVDLADVQKIYIGFGDRDNPQSGGAGVVYFDDILLYQPRCIPALGPAGDIAEPFDCKVNFLDIAVLAGGWLDEGLYP